MTRVKRYPPRRSRLRPLGVLLGVVLIAGLVMAYVYHQPARLSVKTVSKPSVAPASAQPAYPVPAGSPQRLSIPAVGIDAPMTPVSLPPSGDLVPPPDVAAWYADGPKPGAPGPAVIVGHLDTPKGPNVFWNLNKINPGDQVFVRYSDRVLTFTTTNLQTAPQDKLPTSQIWNDTTGQVLRLVTCTGTFNYKTNRYSDNYIVYAKETASQLE